MMLPTLPPPEFDLGATITVAGHGITPVPGGMIHAHKGLEAELRQALRGIAQAGDDRDARGNELDEGRPTRRVTVAE